MFDKFAPTKLTKHWTSGREKRRHLTGQVTDDTKCSCYTGFQVQARVHLNGFSFVLVLELNFSMDLTFMWSEHEIVSCRVALPFMFPQPDKYHVWTRFFIHPCLSDCVITWGKVKRKTSSNLVRLTTPWLFTLHFSHLVTHLLRYGSTRSIMIITFSFP